jgi:hypothetical protein
MSTNQYFKATPNTSIEQTAQATAKENIVHKQPAAFSLDDSMQASKLNEPESVAKQSSYHRSVYSSSNHRQAPSFGD